MSKMPAKKKSCFQITSVTTAQAASSITEDTESLDDPDESRTEDVSSEIFDVSRATDYGPEEEAAAAADRSSSEETLNNVGEADTPGTMSPNVPPEGSLAGSNVTMSRVVGQPGPPPAVACSSRFRVIKLDHGSGEPYRRGRWTCTEFYDKEPDSTVLSRAADTIRHTGGVYEHSADRDSGLGGSSAVSTSHQAPDSIADSSVLSSGTHMAWQQPSPLGGAASQGPVYPASQQMMVQPDQAYPPGHNSMASIPQNVSLASTSVTVSQPQQFNYSQGHLMGAQASSQHVTVMPAQGSTQKTVPSVIGSPSSLPGQQLPQVSGVQFVGLPPKSSDSVSQASGHPVHIQPPGSVASAPPPQKALSQQQVSGSSSVSALRGSHHAMNPIVQNVPSTGVPGLSSSAPSVSAIPVTMPISPATFVQSPLSSHTSVSRSNSLIPTVGLPALQGTTNVHGGQFATQPMAGQLDDRRKSEPLPQPPIPLISEKSFVKVPMADTLTNPLHLPVFGLPIPVDGEEDSSSSANVVAIDNKIEQAMDLVKSHLMYAVREEVEVLREQIKELVEKNSTLERENALLKSLSNNDQLAQLSPQAGLSHPPPPVTTAPLTAPQTAHPPQQPNVSSA